MGLTVTIRTEDYALSYFSPHGIKRMPTAHAYAKQLGSWIKVMKVQAGKGDLGTAHTAC